MTSKFSVHQTLEEAQAQGRRSQRNLVTFIAIVLCTAIGVGAGVVLTQDNPRAYVAGLILPVEEDAPTSSAQQIEAAVARAATGSFNTGLGEATPVAPLAAAEPDAITDLVQMAVQESSDALVAPEPVTPEPETEVAALVTSGNNSDLFSRPAQSDPQCFSDLQNLTREARVYFPSGGTTVDISGIAQARLIGVVAQTCPGVIIQVEGHSDPSGDPGINLALSEQRAQVVVDRIAASGVSTSVFRAVGFGDRVPSNITGPEPAAYYDRRVEFSVVKSGVTSSAATTAASVSMPACVVQMQSAVEQTRVFYRPNSITASQSDLAPVFQLAATAAACPEAKLRVIGHYAEGEGDGETTQTGRMRAVAMMSMIVASGFDAEEVIIASPSSPSLMGPQGINNRRVDFDVIFDPN